MVLALVAILLGADDPAVAASRFAAYSALGCAAIAAVASVITNRRLGRPDEALSRKVERIEAEHAQDRELIYLIAAKVGVSMHRYERRRANMRWEGDER